MRAARPRYPFSSARADQGAPDASRGAGFYWLIAFGVAAVMGLTIMAMIDAFSGRDPSFWATGAMFGGFVVSLAPAVAPMFGKQRPASSVARGPLSARRAAFISLSSMWMALYVLAISSLEAPLRIQTWPSWAGLIAAIAAAAPIGAVIYVLLRYLIREADEYQRLLLTRAALIAAGVSFFGLTLWGLLELYVGVPHLPLSTALAPFCIVFAIANWWVRGRA